MSTKQQTHVQLYSMLELIYTKKVSIAHGDTMFKKHKQYIERKHKHPYIIENIISCQGECKHKYVIYVVKHPQYYYRGIHTYKCDTDIAAREKFIAEF